MFCAFSGHTFKARPPERVKVILRSGWSAEKPLTDARPAKILNQRYIPIVDANSTIVHVANPRSIQVGVVMGRTQWNYRVGRASSGWADAFAYLVPVGGP